MLLNTVVANDLHDRVEYVAELLGLPALDVPVEPHLVPQHAPHAGQDGEHATVI